MYRVLTIDDDNDTRALLDTMLKKLGCRTTSVDSGSAGIVQTSDFQPDLILLDIMMADLSGYEVCTILRSQGYTGRIVLISAIPLSVGRDRAKECGADDYVQKPISTRALIDLFASLLMPAP